MILKIWAEVNLGKTMTIGKCAVQTAKKGQSEDGSETLENLLVFSLSRLLRERGHWLTPVEVARDGQGVP